MVDLFPGFGPRETAKSKLVTCPVVHCDDHRLAALGDDAVEDLARDVGGHVPGDVDREALACESSE